MTAAGDQNKVETAKKNLTYAAIGLLIAALAYAIVNLIIGFVAKQFFRFLWYNYIVAKFPE